MSLRVYELAKELGISSAELVDILKKLQIKKSGVVSYKCSQKSNQK